MPRNLLKGLLLRNGRICARKTILTDFPDEFACLVSSKSYRHRHHHILREAKRGISKDVFEEYVCDDTFFYITYYSITWSTMFTNLFNLSKFKVL